MLTLNLYHPTRTICLLLGLQVCLLLLASCTRTSSTHPGAYPYLIKELDKYNTSLTNAEFVDWDGDSKKEILQAFFKPTNTILYLQIVDETSKVIESPNSYVLLWQSATGQRNDSITYNLVSPIPLENEKPILFLTKFDVGKRIQLLAFDPRSKSFSYPTIAFQADCPDSVPSDKWTYDLSAPHQLSSDRKTYHWGMTNYYPRQIPRELYLLDSIHPLKKRFTFQTGNHLSFAQAIDLDNDGADEFLVNFNSDFTGFDVNGYSSNFGYFAALRSDGSLLWSVKRDIGGGSCRFAVRKSPRLRLYAYQNVANYSPTIHYNVCELEPTSGRILREYRGNGSIAIPTIVTDSLRFGIEVNKKNATARWLTERFAPMPEVVTLPNLASVAAERFVPGKGLPTILFGYSGSTSIPHHLLDEDLQPVAITHYTIQRYQSHAANDTIQRFVQSQDRTIFIGYDRNRLYALLYLEHNPYWWFVRYRWDLIIAGIAFGLGGGGYFGLRFLQKKKLHQQAQKRIHALTIELLRAEENERKRIATDLHDTVAQELLALQFDIMDIQGADNRQVSSISKKIKKITEEVRDISHQLLPTDLEKRGLIKCIASYSEDFQLRTGIVVSCNVSLRSPVEISNEISLTIFRIVQEALTNIRKHAEAKSVMIMMRLDMERLYVTIQDDGKGFDTAVRIPEAMIAKRMGLVGIRERMKMIGGVLSIESQVGKGTVVSIEIPLHQEN
ncbi:MAG: sensor histidine kinase [bacterium]|nr:sensor histidine kinase [bacterium]